MNFLVRGVIEDVDSTTPEDPMHPSLVILVDFGQTIRRVVLTPEVRARRFADIATGRKVRVCGRIGPRMSMLATDVELLAAE